MKPNSKNNALLILVGLVISLQNCTNIQSTQNSKIYTLKILDKQEPKTEMRKETRILKEDSKLTEKYTDNEKSKYVKISAVGGLGNAIDNFSRENYEKQLQEARANFIKKISAKHPKIKESLSNYLQHSMTKKWKNISCATCGTDILTSIGSEFIFDIREFEEERHFDNYSLYCSEHCVEELGIKNFHIGYLFNILNQASATILSDSQYLDYFYRAFCLTENYTRKDNDFKNLIYTKAYTIIETFLNEKEIPVIVLDNFMCLNYDFLLDFEHLDTREMLKTLLFITFCTENEIEELQEAIYVDDLDLERSPITSKSYDLIDTGLSVPRIHCLFATFIKWNTSEEIVKKFLKTFTEELQNLKYDQIYELAKFYTICNLECLTACEKIWGIIGIKNIEKTILLLQCKDPEILKLLFSKTEDGGFFSDNTFNKMSIDLLTSLIRDLDVDKAKAILNCENIDSLAADLVKLINAVPLNQLQIAISKVENDLPNLTREIILRSAIKPSRKTPDFQKSTPEKATQSAMERVRRPIFSKTDNNSSLKNDNEKKTISLVETPKKNKIDNSHYTRPECSKSNINSINYESNEIDEKANVNKTKIKHYKPMPRSEKKHNFSKTSDLVIVPTFPINNNGERMSMETIVKDSSKEAEDNNAKGFKREFGPMHQPDKHTSVLSSEPIKGNSSILGEIIVKNKSYRYPIQQEYGQTYQDFTFQGPGNNPNYTERSSTNSEYGKSFRNEYNDILFEQEIRPSLNSSSHTDMKNPYNPLLGYNAYFAKKPECINKASTDQYPRSCISHNTFYAPAYNQHSHIRPHESPRVQIETTKSQNYFNSKIVFLRELEKLNLPYDAKKEDLAIIMSQFPWLLNSCLYKMERVDQYFLLKALSDKNGPKIERTLLSFFEKSNIKNFRLIENLSEYISKSENRSRKF